MGKSLPLIILMVMLALLFVSWGNVSRYHSNIEEQFQRHMTAAQEYEAKQIYVDAVSEYEKALAMDSDNYELAIKIKDLYQLLNNHEQFLAACQRAKNIDPTKPEMHQILIDYYWNLQEYTTAYSYLKEAQKYFPEDENIKSKILQLKGMYTRIDTSFQEFMGWCYTEECNDGVAVIKTNDKYGLLNPNNSSLLQCMYEEVGPVSAGVFPIKVNGEYYYADLSGNRKIVPDEPAEYLGPFNNGMAVSRVNGVYGYIDQKGKSITFQFEDAGSFSNGVAPVKVQGQWMLITTSFEVVNGLVFEDILMDEYGFCSVYGVFFGKTNGKYHLYDIKGNNLSAAYCDGFEDAKLFVSDQPAAIKMDGKWGYVDKSGVIVLTPTFEDADSFNFSYGPFKENGKWGCIGITGERWIEPTFDYMTAFQRNGLALIKQGSLTQFIKLNYYN